MGGQYSDGPYGNRMEWLGVDFQDGAAFVNMIMKYGVPYNATIFLSSRRNITFREGLFFLQLVS
jgi:hypothetical protein